MDYRVDDKLLTEVKSELQITFTERDDSLRKAIQRGMAFISSRVGPVKFVGDTETEIVANDLLMNYCRYYWDGYRQMFPIDYQSDILHLQILNGSSRRSFNEAKAD